MEHLTSAELTTTAPTPFADDMQSKLNPDYVEALFGLKQSLAAAAHGTGGAVKAAFCTTWGVALPTVHRHLIAECGYDTDRKTRSDKGSSVMSEATINLIAGLKRESLRGNGKAIMPTAVAMNVADANGHTIAVGAPRINALLRQRHLTADALAQPRDTGRMRSLYPNHVHQIDPSLCVVYYLGGKQAIMDAASFNKNKLDNYAKVKLKVWRYVRYDHFSGSLDIRYFEAAGENQASMFDFLQHTWGKQTHRVSHGVPQRLLWDKGSANTSAAVRSLLDALGVQHETHATGHAWAKGGVEVGNNIVETHFESRLKIEPVDDIAQLNAASEAWVRDYNANVIKHVDSRIVRDDGVARVRDDLWQTIRQHEGVLVAMPNEAACRYFFHGGAQSRKVVNLQISFKHPELATSAIYKLHDWAMLISKGETVQVLPLLGKNGAVRIAIEQLGNKPPMLCEVMPTVDFDESGRDMAGQVFGEGYKRLPDSASVKQAKAMNAMVYGVTDLDEADTARSKNKRPFAAANAGKGLTAHSHLGTAKTVAQLLPKAAALDTPQLREAGLAKVERSAMTITEACEHIRGVQGAAYDKATYAQLTARFPTGRVPADVVDELADAPRLAAERAALAAQHAAEQAELIGTGTDNVRFRRVK